MYLGNSVCDWEHRVDCGDRPICDLNDDNWPDIYIANDYYLKDAMYINNKNGTFSNNIKEATKQISFYGMGVDIEDINHDNLSDILVLDMASSGEERWIVEDGC